MADEGGQIDFSPKEVLSEVNRIIDEAKNKPSETPTTSSNSAREKIPHGSPRHRAEQGTIHYEHAQRFNNSDVRVIVPNFIESFVNILTTRQESEIKEAMLGIFRQNALSSRYGDEEAQTFTTAEGDLYRCNMIINASEDAERFFTLSRFSRINPQQVEETAEVQIGNPNIEGSSHFLYWSQDTPQPLDSAKASVNTALAFNRINGMVKRLGGQEVQGPAPKPNSSTT